MPNVQHKRGSRAALNALAASNGLLVGQIYFITDEDRLAVGLSVSSYQAMAKQGEGGGAGAQQVFVQQTRPVEQGPWTWWVTNASGQMINLIVNDGA